MAGRESVFSNDDIIETLNKSFIPVVENVSYTQHRKDDYGKFFSKFADKGHYRGGASTVTGTKQGLYAATASGELLASVNTVSAGRASRLLNHALSVWEDEPKSSRTPDVPETFAIDEGLKLSFPEGGFVLREVMRDMPRNLLRQPDFLKANNDHVWLTKEEVESMIPKSPAEGAEAKLEPSMILRLAKYHLVDSVHGEAQRYEREQIERAELSCRVARLSDNKLHLELTGECLIKRPPTGERNPYTGRSISKEMGTELVLAGRVTYDRAAERVEEFNLVAVGDRWGGDVYNFRDDDMGRAPIGFAFELVDRKDGTAPPQFIFSPTYFENP